MKEPELTATYSPQAVVVSTTIENNVVFTLSRKEKSMNCIHRLIASAQGEIVRKIRCLTGFVVLSVVMLGIAPLSVAQTPQPVSKAELRELLIQVVDRLGSRANRVEAAATLRQRIESLDEESLEYIYQASNNWENLRIAVKLMSKGKASGKEASAEISRLTTGDVGVALSPAGLPADLFPVAYPTGSNYETFRASLVGLGGLSDTPGSLPGLSDESCDANFEAGVAIAAATFAFANIIAEAVCQALPPVTDIPCWLAQGVLQLAAEANNTVAAQCAIVGGAVGGAENEAAFENTVAIFHNLDAHHLALKAHDADVKSAITNSTTSIVNNDNGNTTSILNNANTNTTSILNNDNANTTAILNNNNANRTTIVNNDNSNKNELRDLLLRTQIEADLAEPDEGSPVAWYLTPTANGGHLDLVQAIVTETLANIQAAGGSIGTAQPFLNQANADKAAGLFKDAYKNYRKAYKAAAN